MLNSCTNNTQWHFSISSFLLFSCDIAWCDECEMERPVYVVQRCICNTPENPSTNTNGYLQMKSAFSWRLAEQAKQIWWCARIFPSAGRKLEAQYGGTPTGEGMRFTKVLLCMLALLPLSAHAGKITMSNPDEQELKGGKRLCIYENSIYLFTLVTRSQTCPHSRTFNTNDNEK